MRDVITTTLLNEFNDEYQYEDSEEYEDLEEDENNIILFSICYNYILDNIDKFKNEYEDKIDYHNRLIHNILGEESNDRDNYIATSLAFSIIFLNGINGLNI